MAYAYGAHFRQKSSWQKDDYLGDQACMNISTLEAVCPGNPVESQSVIRTCENAACKIETMRRAIDSWERHTAAVAVP